MTTTRKHDASGFTVIELIVVTIVAVIAGILIFTQVNNVKISNNDTQRKTAINAMHYALEEVYYQQNKSYPASLKSSVLPSVDPTLFTDPDGFTLGKEAVSNEELQKLVDGGEASADTVKLLTAVNAGKSPNYHYDATDCDTNGNCKGYTLRADLQTEAQYVKKNRTH